MYSKIIILDFPPQVAHKAIVCQLVKKFDLLFNILNAQISSQREGHMVLEITSVSREDFNRGVNYLKEQGVNISSAEHEIYKDEDICTHCGACIAVCPTDALYIKRPEMEVLFDRDKCSLCERCLVTCPTRAMGLFSKNKEKIA